MLELSEEGRKKLRNIAEYFEVSEEIMLHMTLRLMVKSIAYPTLQDVENELEEVKNSNTVKR